MPSEGFDATRFIRPHFQQMPAYEPILPYDVLSEQLGLPAESIIKLDANENPYGPIPAVQAALCQLHYMHIYPDPQSQALRQKLSAHLGVPAENLLAGAGADELIDLVQRVLVDPGDAIINCPPTFGMYAFDGELNQAKVIAVKRKPDFSLDIPAILRAIEAEKPKLIFLASPNNPDGSLVPRQEIEKILQMPLILVLDEAYYEFTDGATSMIQEVPRRKNLVVLRTFSKWAGLAGLRVGYGAFPNELMPYLWKAKQPYNISVAASQAAIAALDNSQQLSDIGKRIILERERLFQALSSFSWLSPYPSQANFILCRVTGRDASQVKNQLAKAGILVRYFNKPGLQDHIRISIGTPAQSDSLINKLREME